MLESTSANWYADTDTARPRRQTGLPTPVATETAPRQLGLPRHETPWLHGRVPNGFWDERENRVCYLKWLGQQFGFLRPEDWYQTRKHHFQKTGGGGLLRNEYRSSVLRAMQDYLPDYDWKPWLFGGAPNGFWKSPENRRCYMNWLAEQLGIEKVEDWYGVTGADFFDHHGGGLLNNEFKGSVQALLLDYRPDFQWKAWCFASVPQSYWSKPKNRLDYLHWLGNECKFQSEADWRRLRRIHFYSHQGSGLFVGHYKGSIERVLQELFAESAEAPAEAQVPAPEVVSRPTLEPIPC